MLRIDVTKRERRILAFDTECRPLSFIGGDYVSKEVTVIAYRFVHDAEWPPACLALGEYSMLEMLDLFRETYAWADAVMGHWIRGHDLPLLNGAMLEHGFPPLPDKLTIDTKNDLVNFGGLSKSQKNLAALLDCSNQKLEVDDAMWRRANRLDPVGIKFAKARCESDVRQNIELYESLRAQGFLQPPRMWTGTGRARAYVP